jgi:mannose-6-phosphate isomerase-like protein (cupin superfamily)
MRLTGVEIPKGGAMQRMMLGWAALMLVIAPTMAFSQTAQKEATIVSGEEIQAVVSAPGGGDREIKIVDMGKFNLGVAVLRRGATKPGAPMAVINHTKLTEVYYVVSGEGTIVTGSDVENVRALAADSELVTTVVGPGNNATLKKAVQTRKVKAGDVIIIPAGLYHGFSEVPDHIEYVLVRPDVEKVLPAGYVNPALKK